ncbi:MAG: site-2 protease family protein, partial [Nostoc sp. C3-bin3]|nr:site-2 protease family protein [Nostoc sp. C3-bin3]
MSVLAAIAVLAVLILVHELGHFVAARSQGILVNR